MQIMDGSLNSSSADIAPFPCSAVRCRFLTFAVPPDGTARASPDDDGKKDNAGRGTTPGPSRGHGQRVFGSTGSWECRKNVTAPELQTGVLLLCSFHVAFPYALYANTMFLIIKLKTDK